MSHSFVDESAAQTTDTAVLVGLHTNVNLLPPLLLRDCQEEDISYATHRDSCVSDRGTPTDERFDSVMFLPSNREQQAVPESQVQ